MRNPLKIFWRWVCGGANSVMDKLEDPSSVLAQTIEDMRSEYGKHKQALTDAEVTLKRLQREAGKYRTAAEELNHKVERAVKSGNDGLARTLLSQRKEADAMVKMYDGYIANQDATVKRAYQSLDVMKAKIVEAGNQKLNLENRAKLAELQQKLAEATSTVIAPSEDSAFAAFERIKGKVEDAANRAETLCEIAARESGSPNEDIKLLESGDELDDELAALKVKLLPASTSKG